MMKNWLSILFLLTIQYAVAQNVTVNDLLLAAEDSIQANILEGAYLNYLIQIQPFIYNLFFKNPIILELKIL